MYKVTWDAMSVEGCSAIMKAARFSGVGAANAWAARAIEAGKYNVSIERTL